MPEVPKVPADDDLDLDIDEIDDADREAVENEQTKLREFVKGLSPDDIKSGGWFVKLLATALSTYTNQATWQYFQEKYEGVPADAIVDQRIKMAARYAAIEGGLSASAYTAAIVATLGTAGGASPATIPAAIATVVVDVAYVTQLQIRLAYDIAVLYRVPLDVSDPDDLWKLIRVAFTIKGGELLRDGALKVVPPMMRPLVKTFYKGSVLAAGKALPVVGKFLLQRNIIKIAIPAVGVPLAVGLNHWTTRIAGNHARAVFRNEARVAEVAESISAQSLHPQLMLWVSWLIVKADLKISDDEALLMRHLLRLARDHHDVVDEELGRVVEIDPNEVWRRVEVESGDLRDLLDVANRVAKIDGQVNSRESAVIAELERRINLASRQG